MKQFSNRYIFVYSAILVAVVAVILAVVAVSLKPLQQRNEQCEQMQMILKTIGVEASAGEAEALYDRLITERQTDDSLIFWSVLPDALSSPFKGQEINIFPFRGNGLWGPIWGYIAFDSDLTIVGAVFDHKGETPGLGGEIATQKFAQRFVGKSFKDMPVVLKKHADAQSPYEVDAISGGTMTSNGVTEMLADGWKQYLSL